MTRWWSKPQLRTNEEEEERKVGFLDLFYDLIFVVAIAQVAHGLAKHPDANGALEFSLVFLPIAWLWMGNTFYTDRFETNDVSHRFFTFLQMLPVVGIAVFAHGALEEASTGFILSYVAGRGMIVALWLRGYVHHPSVRPFAGKLTTGFSLGILLWVVSIWFDGPAQYSLWIAGIVVDIITPALTKKTQNNLPSFSMSRLNERFGLFVIIVLGESVAGTVNGLAELGHVTMTSLWTGALAMAFAFSLFWVYFEMVPRDNVKPGFWPFQFRSYLHLPLLAAMAATGAGVLSLVGHEGDVLTDGPRRVLSWSLTITLLACIGLSRVHNYHEMFPKARFRTELSLWIGVVASFAVGLKGIGLSGLETLGILWGLLMILVLGGIITWAFSKRLPVEFQ